MEVENRARQFIERTARRAVKPRVCEPVWQWAERNVQLSVRTTNTPGRYESGWIAYTRLWQEAFSNPRVKEVSICAAAQSGKTESLLNCLRYAIAEDPGPALWIMPAESLARSFSETRLQPSLGDCQPCAEQIPKNRDRFKLLEMHFADMSLNLCGANSPGQLSSRPIRYLFADEIDKFPEAGTKEAGALELAKVRTTTFWNAKLILTSTPTVPGGQIWQAYEAGSQHCFFVKCPHCLHPQQLLFGQLKWPTTPETKPDGEWNLDAVERLTEYECTSCGNQIPQAHKAGMIRGGKWKATNPTAPADRMSFHLNALYSPWRSWGSIAREFLESKDSFSGLQNFTNSVLAEPWKQDVEEVTQSRIAEHRGSYFKGTCPVKPEILTIAADVQRELIYYSVRAWGQDEESWLVDYGRLPTLEDLWDVARTEYPIEGTDETVRPKKGFIDSGFRTQEVYEFCSNSRRTFFPTKGWSKLNQPVKKAAVTFHAGKARRITLYHFDTGSFKSELYLRRIQDGEGPPWHVPTDTGEDFARQLTAEQLAEKKNRRGTVEQYWKQTDKDNHWGDCEVLQVVQGYLLSQRLRQKKELQDGTAQKKGRRIRSSWVAGGQGHLGGGGQWNW